MKRLPDLKMPEVKVPQFAADVYHDLRDRRLLPLVALVAVAIVAVPFLLGGGADEEVQPPTADDAGQPSITATGARLTVVQEKSDLRDHRKRLQDRTRTDPFEQRYTGLPEEAQLETVDVTSGGGSVDGSSVETVTETSGSGSTAAGTPPSSSPESSPPSTGADGGGGPSGASGSGSQDDGLKEGRLYGFRPDVRFGVAGSGELKLHRELPLGSMLPKKNPVLLFVGVTQNGKRALFSVTPEVTLVRGDGNCVGGVRDCRILSMQVHQSVNLSTDQPNRSFRLKVERIEFVQLPMPPQSDPPSGSKGASSEGWANALSPAGQARG